MTTCEKATKLIVKNSETSLSFTEKFTLKFHTMFCEACKLFETQNEIIDQAMSNKDSLKDTTPLTSSKKDDLEEMMKKELNN